MANADDLVEADATTLLPAWVARFSSLQLAAISAALLLLIIGASGYAIALEWRASSAARIWVDHTHAVIDRIRVVADDIQTMEAAARGFIINGDEAFLKPYDRAHAAIDDNLAQLTRLTGDNGGQQARIVRLKALIAQKIDLMNLNIDLRRKALVFMPLDPEFAWRGRQLMESIRALLDGMRGEETRLLDRRNADRERSTRLNLLGVLGISAFATILVAALGVVGFGYLRRRREWEARVVEQAAILSATLESIGQGLSVFDQNLELVAWNDRFREFNGISPGTVTRGRHIIDLINDSIRSGELSPESTDWAVRRIAQMRGGQPYESERVRPNGDVLQIRGSFTRTGLTVTTYSDITALKQIQRDLTHSVSRLRAIFDNTLDGVMTINESGSIESFNPAAERIFGLKASEALGRNIKLIMPEPHRSAHDGYVRRYLASGERKVIGQVRELEAQRADGTLFPIELWINEIHTHDRRLFLGIVRDISDRRQAERAKNEFVSMVSHELRTPLTSIAGALGLLAGGVAEKQPEKARRLVEIASNNAERLVRLVNDILDLEKAESGKLQFSFKPTQLLPLVVSCLEANRAFATSFNVRFALDPDSQDGTVLADPDRMTQVVTNLLSNAAKYSPAGGTVEVKVAIKDERMRISVRDHGPGISPEFRARIFQKFQQADSKDSRAKGGTGLGLSIARHMVERHSGHLTFESEPGQGATFIVEIPLWREGIEAGLARDRESEGPSPASDADSALPRILHVEDDEDVLRVVRLSLDGIAIVTGVRTLAAARRELATQHYQAVIVDIALPDGSGADLLPVFAQARGQRIPTVIFSAQEPDASIAGHADLTLTKSKASAVELVRGIKALTAAPAREADETQPA